MTEATKPEFIYKYEPISTRTLRNLRAQSFYFGSPLNFNDPYDCALNVRIDELTHQELLNLRDRYSQDNIPEQVRAGITSMNDTEFNGFLVKAMRQAIDACKGFCLEFCTEYEPFNLLRPITYSEEIPSVNCASILDGG